MLHGWDGHAIIIDEMSIPWVQLLVIGVALVVAVFWQALFRALRLRCVTAAVLLLTAGACGSQSAPLSDNTHPPLRFKSPVVQLGLIDASRTTVAFPFEVGDSAVSISEVGGSCRCAVADGSLVGQELLPGSHHTLQVLLRPAGDARRQEYVTLNVETTPPSATPLVVAIVYRVKTPPVVSSRLIHVDSAPWEVPSLSLLITHHRGVNDTPIRLLQSASDWGEFEVVNISRKTESVTSTLPGDRSLLAIDSTTVKLAGTRRSPIGKHHGQLMLRFSDQTTQSVAVAVNVRHPFHVLVHHPFIGRVDKGKQWSLSVPVRYLSDCVNVATINCDAGNIEAQVAGSRVVIRGTAPLKAGRFRANVVLTFVEPGISEVAIQISGIVE